MRPVIEAYFLRLSYFCNKSNEQGLLKNLSRVTFTIKNSRVTNKTLLVEKIYI